MNDQKIPGADLGMIGLGTMGRNLMLNMADHGYQISGYDKNADQVSGLNKLAKKYSVQGYNDLSAFIGSLKSPKIVMMLVPAGKIVDSVIEELSPLLGKDDLLIDAGNSYFKDTDRRAQALEKEGLHYFGMGVSGGEEGARHGPSMMPGGDQNAYKSVKPLLDAIAAKVDGESCVTYIGPKAAGHFVKMVHNGIEYAQMQLIVEAYEILKTGLQLDNPSIHQVFKEWNESELESYLLKITSEILIFKSPGTGQYLLDQIKDEAKAKGTGKWTSQSAMDLQVPVPTIDIAVSMRDLSKYKDLRISLNDCYQAKQQLPNRSEKEEIISNLKDAFQLCSIVCFAQGLHLLQQASVAYDYDLKLGEIAKIWRGGCIIRAEFLNNIASAYQENPELKHLLLDSKVQSIMQNAIQGTQKIISTLITTGIPCPAFCASLNYFNSFKDKNSPANLIQAQRDFFGAHQYELIGKSGNFHTEWEKKPAENK